MLKRELKHFLKKESQYGQAGKESYYMTNINIDIPEILLTDCPTNNAVSQIQIAENGVLAGMEIMINKAKELGLEIEFALQSGTECKTGTIVAKFTGASINIIKGENQLLGLISKPSGIATAVKKAINSAGKIQVVCGGWKKVIPETKNLLRDTVSGLGLKTQITSEPFVYLDKNYVRLFGSIERALESAKKIKGRIYVIQIKGETDTIYSEAVSAAIKGAHVIMVDTGSLEDFRKCSDALKDKGLRDNIKLALAGGIKVELLEELQNEDIDVVDIGRPILDAPMIDFKYDIVS